MQRIAFLVVLTSSVGCTAYQAPDEAGIAGDLVLDDGTGGADVLSTEAQPTWAYCSVDPSTAQIHFITQSGRATYYVMLDDHSGEQTVDLSMKLDGVLYSVGVNPAGACAIDFHDSDVASAVTSAEVDCQMTDPVTHEPVTLTGHVEASRCQRATDVGADWAKSCATGGPCLGEL